MLLRHKGYGSIVIAMSVCITTLAQISSGTDSSADQLCDLQSWFTEAEADGAFVDAEPEVAAIEAEVRGLLDAQEDALVKCSVINGYEELIYGTGEEGEEGEAEGESEGELSQEEGYEDEADGLLDDDEGTEPSEYEETPQPETEQATEAPVPAETPAPTETQVPATETVEKLLETMKESDDVNIPESEKVKEPSVPGTDEAVKEEAIQTEESNAEETTQPSEPEAKMVKEKVTIIEGSDDRANEEPDVIEKDLKASQNEQQNPPTVPETPAPNTSHEELTEKYRVSNQELLTERLLAEQLRADYSTKMKDLEMQLIKMENKLLVGTAEKHNNTSLYTRMENQMLKLENELLKINASFTILRAENAQLAAQLGVDGKSQYPALPDNNASMVSTLVDKHQNRISELSEVITKQSDVITALDKKSELLEERNSELRKTLVDQSDVIKDIIKNIENLREVQEKQKHEQEKETKRLYDVIASAEDAREIRSKESDSGSRNLSAPETLGGASESHDEAKTQELKGANVELPGGTDGKVDTDEVQKPDVTQKQPESPKTQDKKEADVPQQTRDDNVKDGPSIPDENSEAEKKQVKEDSKESEAATTSETAENGSCTKPQEKPNVKKLSTKKGKGTKTKKKKVLKKKKSGEKKVVKKKRTKGLKKASTLAVPPPKYIDESHVGAKDCYDHYTRGRKRDAPQRIRPVGLIRDSDVFCDMRNGGWTVILRRQDGSTDFYRNWSEYQKGFGGTYGDHWAGLELLHRLTNQGHYQLRVDLTDWQRNSVFAIYDLIRVEGEDESYRLHVAGYSGGTAGDGFAGHSGMKFSTFDRDNDMAVKDFGGSCAQRFHGAWWYNKCYKSNPTGRYYRGGKIAEGKYDGLAWKPWTGSDVSLKRIEMKIRPKI